MLEHRVAAAARLDAARDGQVAVALQEELACKLRTFIFVEPRAHVFNFRQRRFDEAAISRGLGKYILDERSEALQPRLGIVDVRARERQRSERGVRAPDIRVHPGALMAQLQFPDKFLTVEHYFHSCSSVMYCWVPR